MYSLRDLLCCNQRFTKKGGGGLNTFHETKHPETTDQAGIVMPWKV